MELIPPLPIEDTKANRGLDKNSIDKSYFVCDKLLAIFETSKDKTFVFEYGWNVRYRLYISQKELLKEHSEAYVFQLIVEMPTTRIKVGEYTTKHYQEWLDSISK